MGKLFKASCQKCGKEGQPYDVRFRPNEISWESQVGSEGQVYWVNGVPVDVMQSHHEVSGGNDKNRDADDHNFFTLHTPNGSRKGDFNVNTSGVNTYIPSGSQITRRKP